MDNKLHRNLSTLNLFCITYVCVVNVIHKLMKWFLETCVPIMVFENVFFFSNILSDFTWFLKRMMFSPENNKMCRVTELIETSKVRQREKYVTFKRPQYYCEWKLRFLSNMSIFSKKWENSQNVIEVTRNKQKKNIQSLCWNICLGRGQGTTFIVF